MRVLAVLALCAAIFGVGLDAYDLDSKGEPREGFTAWEMIHSGEWALPHLDGEALPEKPLVFPWLVAVSTLALGEGGELAPRLPSALMASGLVLVVFCLGRRLQGDGVRPAVICATMGLVILLARRARVDMTLAFFVTFALLQLLRGLERPRAGTIALFWLALALGTLTKGPIGAGLPLLVAATYLFVEGRLADARRFLAGLPILLVVAGSWYAYGLIREGQAFAYRTFMMENVLMFVGAETGGGHVHPTYYYLKYLPLHTTPWCLYVPGAVWLAWKRRREPGSAFLLSWAGSLFVFFSIARGKRGDYLLPLMPAFALMVAALWREGGPLLRSSSIPGAVAGIAGLLGYPLYRRFLPFDLGAPVFLGGALVTIAPWLLLLRDRRRGAIAAIAGGMTLIVMHVAVAIWPAHQRSRPFVADVARISSGAPLVQRGVFDYTSLYYLRRRIPSVEAPELERTLAAGGFALVSYDEWGKLPPRLHAQVAAVSSERLLLGQRRP